MMPPSPVSDLVEHISAHSGSLPPAGGWRRIRALRDRAVRLRAAGAEGALVHLSARTAGADLGILRCAERAVFYPASAAVQKQLTGHTAVQGASVQCMQAIEIERSPGLPSP